MVGIPRLMDAGKISVWGRFGTFVPSDQECASVREVTSGRSDWMFANLIEFLFHSIDTR